MQNIFQGSKYAIRTISLLLMAAACWSCGDDGGGQISWQLAWEDNFDGAPGDPVDAADWNYDIGTGANGWGNFELQYYTDRSENVSLDGNGNLTITAREESFMGSDYTSGRITTKGKFDQAYGRFEARIKMPSGRGLWPAFWMLGSNIDDVNWPQCGEIDIVEFRGQEPDIIHATVHGPGYSGGAAVTESYIFNTPGFDTEFRVFAVEWFENRIDYFVDDRLYHQVALEDVPGEWVFNQPFYILLNVAVGGTFVGPPGINTTFPQTMLIDYVRVYEAVE